MDKIRDVLNQFKGEYKETPDDLLALFKWAIDEEEDDLLKSLIFPGSALISVIHPESKETSLYIASRWRYNTNGALLGKFRNNKNACEKWRGCKCIV